MQNIDHIQWPGWSIVRLIGRGSFGAVYEIQRNVFGETERAALKVLTIPENGADIDDLRVEGYDDESIISRFHSYLEDIVKEYSTMAKMKGHPNVVYCDDVKYVQHDDGIGWDIYIKMELLTPIMKCLDRMESESAVIDLGVAMCNALVLCKEYNIVHRDIKPQNIFVTQDGTFKLGDFGIAKTAERTTSGTKIGTYKYMAPEVYNNRPYGPAADQYSLGLVMYWLLNDRRTPFSPKKATATEDDNARKRRFDGEQIPPPAHGSKQLQAIVLKACAYDLKQRYASASEMLEALKSLKSELSLADSSFQSGVSPFGTVGAGAVVVGTATTPMSENLASRTVGRRNSTPIEDGTVGRYRSARSAHATTSANNGQCNQQNRGASEVPPAGAQQEQEKKKKKRGIAAWISVATGLIVVSGGIVPLMLSKNNDTRQSESAQLAFYASTTGESPTVTEAPTTVTEMPTAVTEPVETLPVQLDWADWTDALPDYVTDENYTIEERTLYSSRSLETTSSTASSKMDGWELYDTASRNGDYGAWSDWSQTPATKSDTRDIEQQTRYRYRDKETTTSSSSSLSGWTQYNATTSWGDWGSWSSWSTDSVSQNDSRQVETKTQYRYRDISYTTQYTDWGSWSGWQDSYVASNDLTDVETRTAYHYYYYVCSNCGTHMHGYGTCYTWAGGCGSNSISSDSYHAVRCTVPYSNAYDFHGTGTYYTDNTGEGRGFAYIYPSSPYYLAPITQYRYRTRSTYQEANYGNWSSWGDTFYSSSSSCDVDTRTVYRYRVRSQVSTYYYYRWEDWSAWSTTAVSQSSTKEVETTTFYRYRDRVTQTTYYFRRWTDWSAYFESLVEESDTVEVRTKTQYRYRSK